MDIDIHPLHNWDQVLVLADVQLASIDGVFSLILKSWF